MKQPLMTAPPAQAEALFDNALEDETNVLLPRVAPLCWADEDWGDDLAPGEREPVRSFPE